MVLYKGDSLDNVLNKWERLKKEEQQERLCNYYTEKYISRFSKFKESFLRRMWNASEFMRTFKQHLTMSYNWRREHTGTLWESRYNDKNHAPEEQVMWRTAAYVDANPVNAGVVVWPDGYEWCSFAAACKGDEKSRRGYAFIYGESGGWPIIKEKHEISIREALNEIARKRLIAGKTPGVRLPVSKTDPRIAEPDVRMSAHGQSIFLHALHRGNPYIADEILELLKTGPMSSTALREQLGIRRRDHFNAYYLKPLLMQKLIERTNPNHPSSPLQKYQLCETRVRPHPYSSSV